MIKYICKKCSIESDTSVCPNCGERAEMQSSTLFWCKHCQIPTYEDTCSECGSKCTSIASDLRPVFPDERLLIELIWGKPLAYLHDSVWRNNSNYYIINGKRVKFSMSDVKDINVAKLRANLEKYREENKKNDFLLYINRFIKANKGRYDYITNEAMQYIREKAADYECTSMFVSFSGGKDSTVVSDLVMRALSTQKVLHIYGDTTLEFPMTKQYADRFRKNHPQTPFLVSINKDKDFNQLCETLGPPSRVMRWCCTIFKTGAIQRKISTLFRNQNRILTFYGIRRNESNSRSKYDRESNSPKITKQKTVSPIIDWMDFDIWLYLLSSGADFNDAYRLGYARVGCWCCPNNTSWSGFLAKIYMPEESEKFRNMLLEFAKKIGKPDPEVYVDDGWWKARQGGNGLEYAQTSLITFEPCVLEDNAMNFELQKPIDDDFYELFKPFGHLNFDVGNQRLGEVYVTDRNGKFLLKLQGRKGSRQLKVTILDKTVGHSSSMKQAEEKVRCQITKFQMCMGCLACESICKQGAISIAVDKNGMKSYRISDTKCVRCGECVNHFIGGCYMRKVMTIKR